MLSIIVELHTIRIPLEKGLAIIVPSLSRVILFSLQNREFTFPLFIIALTLSNKRTKLAFLFNMSNYFSSKFISYHAHNVYI